MRIRHSLRHDPLGIPGFTFADLHARPAEGPARPLPAEAIAQTEPDLAAVGAVPARCPRRSGPSPRGNLIVADGAAPQPLRGAAVQRRRRGRGAGRRHAAYDDLFRFKIDFVRRRALPLLKGGAHVQRDRRGPRATSEAVVSAALPATEVRLTPARRACKRWRSPRPAARCSIARGGPARRRQRCREGRRGRADRVAQALVRRAHARPALPRAG